MAIKICLDAGHYGKYNQSSVLRTYYESEMTWKLTNLLKAELLAYGFEVTLTRAVQKKDLYVYERGKLAKGCDLFLSIHSNAADSGQPDYPAVGVQLDGKGDELGKKLADIIAKTMGTKQPGKIFTRAWNGDEYYGVLRGSRHVGVVGLILEHSFHTNLAAAKWLSSDANLKKMAVAEAKVIADHYGVKKPAASSTAPVIDGMEIYRVRKSWDDAASQIGAYYSLERAQEAADKNPGYSVFDSNGKCVYTPGKKTVEEVAREVISGKWGVGTTRKAALEKAGYVYSEVQAKVNELMKK